MKNLCYLFTLLLFVSLVACKKEIKNDGKTPDGKAPATTVATTPTNADLEDMKKNDVKAYTRTKYDKIVSGFQSPESVITDGTFFYVSNVGAELAPSKKDADGFISKLDGDGNILELKWLSGDGLHAPKGMAIVNGVLYVADVDKVRGYNMKSKKKTFQVDLSSTRTVYLNDLTVRDNNTLYVSATDLGYIYKVNLKGGGSFEMVDIYSDLSGANGLVYDKVKDRLLIASFGQYGKPNGMIGVCPLNTEKLKQKYMGTYHGYLDGIQIVADDMILMTDWQNLEKGGNLLFYDLVTEEIRPLLGGLIGGPADFYYDAKTKNVWLPAMQDNELIITKLDIDLVRKDQGTLINSSGGYEVRTKDKIEFPQK